MTLLVLPLLAFVAAHESAMAGKGGGGQLLDANNANELKLERRRAVNGTELTLECASAGHLVRTHMAPDFEHPQLVRRLDWMREGALIASFRQEATMEMSQQWWVSSGRFELQRPFFGLKIGPILPQDAGQWKCRLETDALFAAELPQNGDAIDLVVLMRPPTPPKPSIVRHSDNSVTLEWTKFTTFPAHQPILRFSVLIAQPDANDDNGIGLAGRMRILVTADNQTGIEVAGLRPNTRYAFSVRAENAIGESQFGPEILFRTIGLPPKKSPEIHFLRNGTSPDCVDLEWTMPNVDNEPSPIVGFRIMVHRVGTGAMREWYVKGAKVRNQSLCSLKPNADYVLTLEADNGFGYSAGTTAPFNTDQSIPDGPPQLIQCRPLLGGNALTLNWRPPLVPNGPIRAFFIYFKDVPSQKSFAQIRLDVSPEQSLTAAFAFNLTKLLANTRYKIRISAATDKGEGPKSEPILVDTDFEAPKAAPNISTLSFGCDSNLLSLEWNCSPELLPEGVDGLFQISVHSSMANGTNPRVFNISTASPHKLLLDQINLGEHLFLSISLLIRSRSDPANFLAGPLSALAHFALISNGWRCRYRSSVCSSASTLPPSSYCEYFPDEAAASIIFGQQQQSNSAAIGHHGPKVVPDANMPFIFLIFGAFITLTISLLFGCILRRRCLLFKSFLRGKQQQKGRRANGKWRENGGEQQQESTSLVKKAQAECSVILPSITVGRVEGDGTVPKVGNGANNACCCELGQFEGGRGPIVNVLEFEAHFSEMSANGNAGFERQFKEIERETTAILLEEAKEEEDGEENNNGDGNGGGEGEKMKDRYLDIGALPKKSRIRLAEKGGSGAYINANFVDSCDQRRAYIATQAPLPHTFSDFWAMVWQEKCQILVALTNMVECGRRKCDQYWPDRVGAKSQFGHYLVILTGERSNSVFTHRMLQLRRKMVTSHIGMDQQECRILHQLHFMAWPDHGVPDSPFPLLHFINYAADLQCSSSTSSTTSLQNANPIIVHCSAGVGRSGAFILIDSLRRHLLQCDRIDVCGQLRRMRRQRVQLVQNLEQYVFCHQVIRHLVENGISRQPRSHFSNYCRFLFTKFTPSGLLRIQAQFQDLLCCPHGPKGCEPPLRSIPLPGYHRVDEFLICPTQSIDWLAIWEAKCQSLTILDSRNPTKSTVEGEILHQLLPSTQICIERGIQIEWNGTNRIIMKPTQRNGHGMKKNGMENGEEVVISVVEETANLAPDQLQTLQLTVHQMCTAELLANPWNEIEKLQLELQNQHRSKQALFEYCSPCRSHPSAAPFIFCALQSAACQLEQEAAVDVLLWLVSYKHAFCGCWTDLAEIELIYQKVMELVEIQRALC